MDNNEGRVNQPKAILRTKDRVLKTTVTVTRLKRMPQYVSFTNVPQASERLTFLRPWNLYLLGLTKEGRDVKFIRASKFICIKKGFISPDKLTFLVHRQSGRL